MGDYGTRDVRVTPDVSILVPVYNEAGQINRFLNHLFESAPVSSEILVVYDTVDDTTVPELEIYALREPRLRPTLNTYGRGPSAAIRYGMEHALANAVVVTMADESDDPRMIEPLTRLIEEGAAVAAASRYSRGGCQIGGPRVKRTMSRLAGLSLFWLARVGTRDATNSFKAYSRPFLEEVGVHSNKGFEIGIELVAKARRLRLPVAELPTTWIDRGDGQSNFRIVAWLPSYLRWYFFAFGSALTPEEVRRKAAKVAR
jgi:dolichol-phosphate mannosyltransferase